MSGVTVTVDDRQVREALQHLATRLRDLGPVLDAIGAVVLKQTQMRFRNQAGPDGQPWKPSQRAQGLRAGVGRGKAIGDTLRDTGRLRNSLSFRGAEGNVFELGDSSVLVGTNVVYAAMMQFGATRGQFGSVQASIPRHQVRSFVRRDGVAVRAHERGPFVRTQPQPWGPIPPRPFVGTNDADLAEILATMAGFLMPGGQG